MSSKRLCLSYVPDQVVHSTATPTALLWACQFMNASSVATRSCSSTMHIGSATSLKCIFCIFCFTEICTIALAVRNLPAFDECLLDLRLTELLKLKKSMQIMSLRQAAFENRYSNIADERQAVEAESCERPVAMALVERERGYAIPAASYQPLQPEEKPSKLQTLFQISITALAFLSFGGYLLCLIVQAIKSKGTTYFHPVATATTTTPNGGVKRIKIYRRSRRQLSNDIDTPLPHPYTLYQNYNISALSSFK